MVSEVEAPAYASDPRWRLVERILATPEFQRSPRLSEFLKHICELTLQGRDETISEQYLGQTLFGRSADYDSSSDTIVRSHALRLRKRLEQYFQRSGSSESLRLVIPVGGYIPSFIQPASTQIERDPDISAETSLTSLAASQAENSIEETVEEVVLARTKGWKIAFAASILFSLLLSSVLFFHLHTEQEKTLHSDADRGHPLWSRLFNKDEPTQIVLGDSGLVLFHAASRRYVSLQDYVNNDLSKQMPYVEHVDPAFAHLLAGRRYTSLVDATAAVRLVRLPEARPDRTLVSFSRDMHLDDFKNGNVVMIGAQEADPWVELFERQMDFVFSIDTPDHHTVFLNRHPLPKEPSVFDPQSTGSPEIYAVIAFMPNLTANGNVLLLEGNNMAGSESAVDLVLDDNQLLPILSSIRRRDGSIPHFEMVIAANVVKDSAAPAHVVSIHVH
jgi:hypothetical protein